MTMNEISEKYEVPLEVLKEYERWELDNTVEKKPGKWEYNDRDIELLDVVMTLRDIGFEQDVIKLYMQLLVKGKSTGKQRLTMLNQKRAEILDEVHSKETKINRLDYLRHELQTSEAII